MEAKRSSSAAIAAVCVLLLVTLSGQVSAKSKFCECYEGCYPTCRHHVARFLCVPFCANKCSPSQATATAAVGGSGDSCLRACAAAKICGQSDPPAETVDVETCAQTCKRKIRQN